MKFKLVLKWSNHILAEGEFFKTAGLRVVIRMDPKNMTDNQIRETPPEKVPEQQGSNYQVIAGKYRPLNFSNLIGQELMVRTLTKLLRPNFF